MKASKSPKPNPGKFTTLRSGPNGPPMIMTEEDAKAFSELSERYLMELQPKGALEESLVHGIVNAHWRMKRMAAIGNSLATIAREGDPDGKTERSIEKAGKQEDRLTRMLIALHKELERTQAVRRKNEISQALQRPDQSSMVH